MKLDELLGYFRTYEMNLQEREPEKKSKGVALKAAFIKFEDDQDFAKQLS